MRTLLDLLLIAAFIVEGVSCGQFLWESRGAIVAFWRGAWKASKRIARIVLLVDFVLMSGMASDSLTPVKSGVETEGQNWERPLI